MSAVVPIAVPAHAMHAGRPLYFEARLVAQACARRARARSALHRRGPRPAALRARIAGGWTAARGLPLGGGEGAHLRWRPTCPRGKEDAAPRTNHAVGALRTYSMCMSSGRLRDSGIRVIGEVPWGTHLCLFYETRRDLIEMLVPYFAAGLEANESCI